MERSKDKILLFILLPLTVPAAGVTASCYNGCSAALNITVLDNTGFTERTTIADTALMADAAWSAPKLQNVTAGTAVQEYGAGSDGRWRKVKCGDALLSLQPLRL